MAPDLSTTPAQIADNYFGDGGVGEPGDQGWDSPHRHTSLIAMADRIVGLLEPTTSLDVGCGNGKLVQALMAKGVDAHGRDVSEHAVESAHPNVRSHLTVAAPTEPIERRYDLITCVEVLEHLRPEDAQTAIDVMCAASDRILFSSTPGHFDRSTHVNVHPTAQWAAWFAERGFFRRTDADVTFLTTWAVLFERADLSKRAIVERYETQFAPLNTEVIEKRRALVEAERRLAADASASRRVDPDDAGLLARHSDLTAIDHVLGLEATVARLAYDLKTVRTRARRLKKQLADRDAEIASLRGSRAWKVGRLFKRPLERLKG